MQDWNVVVTVTEGGFVKGIRFLEPFGEVSRTDYFNFLIMKAAEDPYAIVAVETVGTQAGLSLWTREDLNRYPFLRID